MLKKSYSITLTLILFYSISVFAQPSRLNNFAEEFGAESIYQLKNDTIRREIASFIKLAKIDSLKNNIEQIAVREIPLKKCTEDLAYFAVQSIWSTHLIVSIELSAFDTTLNANRKFFEINGTMPQKQIKKITSLHGPHVNAKIPDSAYTGIYDSDLCNITIENGKKVSATCKLYLSSDGSRRYLYAVCGSGKDRFEVVWIINKVKYFGRVINKIN